MARPLRRDYFAWFTSLPASGLLVACLFLPQVKGCQGQIETPFDTNAAPMMIGLALIGVLPLAWRWKPMRQPAVYLVAIGGACTLVISVVGVALAIVIITVHRRINEEQLVALSCAMLAMIFILLFPLFGLFGTWLDGAYFTWFAAWLELVGMFVWMSAAGARDETYGLASFGHSSSLR